MSLQDRDWYREEVRQKSGGKKNKSSTAESEFDRLISGRRRWSFLPGWTKEWLQGAAFFGVVGLLYLAWTHFRG